MSRNGSTDRTRFIPMAGGLSVAVRDARGADEGITAWVLDEQGDWFEDEIAFVRRVLQPGERAIDVGANVGVYALTLASLVGPVGRVWAFEPARRTAALLRASVAENRLDNLVLVEAGLSNRRGAATLYTSADSELNALSRDGGQHSAEEPIALRTLDECDEELDLRGLAFVKLDAEGEETRVVEGGARVLARESPLVMYELRHGGTVNDGLIEALARAGYASYALLPGPGVLVPIDDAAKLDPYQLNLFACRPDRARTLAARGLLATADECAAPDPSPARAGAWSDWMASRVYGYRLASAWSPPGRIEDHAGGDAYRAALDDFCVAGDREEPAARRAALARRSLATIASALDRHAGVARLLSLARVARAAGQRQVAVDALHYVIHFWHKLAAPLRLDEPLVPPTERFEALDPGDDPSAWCLGAAIDGYERWRAFSAHFTGTSALPHLETLERFGLLDDHAARRLALVRQRAARRAA